MSILKKLQKKIVIYGPAKSGKTTFLEKLANNIPELHRGRLFRLATERDSGQEFEKLSIEIDGCEIHVFTVPGGQFYNQARLQILRDTDGIIFVASNAPDALHNNQESLDLMLESFAVLGLRIVPIVFFENMRQDSVFDMAHAMRAQKMANFFAISGSALTGQGVFPAMKHLVSILLQAHIIQEEEKAKTMIVKKDDNDGPKKFCGRQDHYKEYGK